MKGYKLVAKEFDSKLRKITMMGYGLILISHDADKTFTDEEGVEFQRIVPTLDKRASLVINRLVDFIGYVKTVFDKPSNTYNSRLFLRETPRFMAGSRYKYMPREIELSYDELVAAIHDAIDKEAAERGGEFVKNEDSQIYTQYAGAVNYDDVKAEFDRLTQALLAADPSLRTRIKGVVESHLGKSTKVSDCPRSQAGMIELINNDLQEMLEGLPQAPVAPIAETPKEEAPTKK